MSDEFEYQPEDITPLISEDDTAKVEEATSPIIDEWDMPEGYSYHNPLEVDDKLDPDEVLPLPSGQADIVTIKGLIEEIAKDDTLSPARRKEIGDYLLRLSHMTLTERYDDMVGDKKLAQYLMSDAKRVTNTFLSSAVAEGTDRLSGDAARRRIQAMLGTGENVVWRLWHSGFTVQLGGFTPGEIFTFQTQLLTMVEDVGMKTNGQIISADDAHLLCHMTDFVLDHVTDTTIKGWTKAIIEEHLDVRDLYTLLVGGLAAMYPRGYPFVRDCTYKFDSEGSCDWSTLKAVKNVDELVRLDFRMVTHIDTDRFTAKQARLINMPMQSVTLKDIEDYRNDFKDLAITSGPLNEQGKAIYKVVIRAPMYKDYRLECKRWLSDVVMSVDRALETAPDLGLKASTERRQNAIRMLISRLTAQRHSSWIREIIEESTGTTWTCGGENVGEMGWKTREEVMDRLGDLSASDEVSDALIDAVEDFKAKYTHAFVGIPNYKCPACGRGQSRKSDKRPGIIPIPVVHYFFVIMVLSSGQRR